MPQNNSNKKLTKIACLALVTASFCVIFIGLLFSSSNLKAQIKNLYNETSQEVGDISALMSAVVSHDAEGVRFFSKAGPATINQKNLGGATALHIASRVRDFTIAKILVENGANVNAVDNEGWTPLMRASLAADADTVNLLLDVGAQAGQLNSVSESAIIQATLSDCDECLKAMFTKFNFIKLVDNKLLRDQISKAFTIARNRDNQVTQNILNQYLDQAVKVSPLIDGTSEDIAPETNKQPVEGDVKEKIFKIMNNDSSDKKSEDLPIIITKDAEKNKSQTGKKYLFKGGLTNQSKTIDEKQSENIAKKFRFISGPQGQNIEIIKTEPLPEVVKPEPTPTPAEVENEKVVRDVIYNFKQGSKAAKAQDVKIEKDDVIMLNEKVVNPAEAPDDNKASGGATYKLNKASQIGIIQRTESAADVIEKSNKIYKIMSPKQDVRTDKEKAKEKLLMMDAN